MIQDIRYRGTVTNGDGFEEINEYNDCSPSANPDACDIKREGIDQNRDGFDRKKVKPCSDTVCIPIPGEEIQEFSCADGIDKDSLPQSVKIPVPTRRRNLHPGPFPGFSSGRFLLRTKGLSDGTEGAS